MNKQIELAVCLALLQTRNSKATENKFVCESNELYLGANG